MLHHQCKLKKNTKSGLSAEFTTRKTKKGVRKNIKKERREKLKAGYRVFLSPVANGNLVCRANFS